jgi:hypothetical protein
MPQVGAGITQPAGLALYVRTDDLLKASPERAPWRPNIGIAPKITDAELISQRPREASYSSG